MITKITTENQTQIQEAIRTNGQGAITGDILQEKMLLLNRDLFGGEIEYDTHILLADVEDAVANMRLQIDSDLFNFVKEWYSSQDWSVESTWQNNYIALYGGRNNAFIVGYMRLCFKRNWAGEEGILCYLLGCDSDLLKFIISPESPDMENNYIGEITYRGEPRILDMRLSLQPTTTFPDYNSMLEAIGISPVEWEQLKEGKYAFVRNVYFNIPRIYPLQECDAGRVFIGYANSGEDMGITWELYISMENNTYEINCYDNL